MQSDEKCCLVSDRVFTQFPGYVRGVVVAHGLKNGDAPDALVSLLREAEESLRQRLNLDTLVQDPRIVSWRDAYRSFGAKPSKFRPSMEAMTRRVLRDDHLPPINTLVAIGNVVSLRHLVPAGGHAIDVIAGDMELRPANGDEEFTPLDSDQMEHPMPGEIIFVDGKTVMTRRWTWRQARHTLIGPTTTAVEVNVDGMPPVPVAEVEAACGEIIELIERFCGGTTRYEILSPENPRMRL